MISVYSKEGCIFCDKIKKYLREHGLEFIVYELDVKQDRETIDWLKSRSEGHKTFPWIFINDNFIGGFTKFKDKFEKLELSKYNIEPDF